VGCTEQELHAIVSTQLYTVIALGAGLYAYKTFTAENWFDIAIEIGWGCVCVFTQLKRLTTRHIVPVAHGAFSFLKNQVVSFIGIDSNAGSNEERDDGHCYVRVIKDGFEMQGHSCIYGLVEHLLDHVEEADESESDDVIDVDLDDVGNGHANECEKNNTRVSETEDSKASEANEANEPNEANEANEANNDPTDNGVMHESETEDENGEESDDETTFQEKVCKAENHTMKFDFVLCQIPTPETETSDNPMCMYTVKYDGFPRDNDGSYFFERKFVPVSHRMMEVVLHYGETEYEINLSSPNNFYVLGNKLLDPAFLKWFVRKNHGVSLDLKGGVDDATLNSCNYTIKCIDNNANLHTLQPCNYIRVCENGFEVHDSGLV
jgi:hypothetical protein